MEYGQMERVLSEFHAAGKPLALCCIAPILAAKVLGKVENMFNKRLIKKMTNDWLKIKLTNDGFKNKIEKRRIQKQIDMQEYNNGD